MSLPPGADALGAYEALVRKYHRTLDLVSDAALARFADLIEQSRAYANRIASVAPGADVLDVGSGVGLPGIVIAALLPDRRVVLVERRRRRSTFLKLVVAQLGLENARVLEADVRDVGGRARGHARGHTREGARPSEATAAAEIGSFGVVSAQAVASFTQVYCMSRHLHADRVVLVSRKGPGWQDEANALAAAIDAVVAVVGEPTRLDGGTLVSIEVRGGLPCPPSA